MLRYVYFGTNNLENAITFYDAALAPLDMQRCVTEDPEWDRVAAGWGVYEDAGARELGFWVGKTFPTKTTSAILRASGTLGGGGPLQASADNAGSRQISSAQVLAPRTFDALENARGMQLSLQSWNIFMSVSNQGTPSTALHRQSHRQGAPTPLSVFRDT